MDFWNYRFVRTTDLCATTETFLVSFDLQTVRDLPELEMAFDDAREEAPTLQV